jgi:hypothetical protein
LERGPCHAEIRRQPRQEHARNAARFQIGGKPGAGLAFCFGEGRVALDRISCEGRAAANPAAPIRPEIIDDPTSRFPPIAMDGGANQLAKAARRAGAKIVSAR